MIQDSSEAGISTATDSTAEQLSEKAEQQYRADYYNFLARLLSAEPDFEVMQTVAGLAEIDAQHSELEAAMSMLGLSAGACSLETVREEYFKLFIGLGRGELVPYGSWYQTGYLMEKPLGELRDNLRQLGFERDESVREPEDHVAALFEVMAMLIMQQQSLAQQKAFFDKHVAGWIERFTDDLANAKSATFYKAVARFAAVFVAFEKRYLGS